MKLDSKIYIAGHRGLVGSAILRRLQAEEYGNLIYRTRKELELTQQSDVYTFFEKERPEYVFLAAAKVGGILANSQYPADFIYQNLIIQTNIIHASYLTGVKKLLFLGSSCIYPRECPQPMKEEYLLGGKLEPTNEPYSVAKIAGIKMCQSYNRQYGTHFISVMPTNLYGPHDNFDLNSSHVLPALIRKTHLGKCLHNGDFENIRKDLKNYPLQNNVDLLTDSDIVDLLSKFGIKTICSNNSSLSTAVEIWGTGSPRREFLHVDDLADACVFLMKHYNDSEIINIGTGKDITIKELAELIKETIGFEGEIVWDKTKPDGVQKKLLETTKLKSLGWVPKIGLRDGIKQTYEWYVKIRPAVESNISKSRFS